MPGFHIMLSMLIIPSLVLYSEIIGRDVVKQILSYSGQYSKMLSKHLGEETEIQMIDGNLAEDSQQVLNKLENEMQILQYKKHLIRILDAWADQITGHPVYPEVHNVIYVRVEDFLNSFHSFIQRVQKHSLGKRRGKDNALCNQVCKSKTRIINLTRFPISKLVEDLFKMAQTLFPKKHI